MSSAPAGFQRRRNKGTVTALLSTMEKELSCSSKEKKRTLP